MTKDDVVAAWETLRTEHRAWVMDHPGAVQYANSQSWRRRWIDREWVQYGMHASDASEIGCWAYDMVLRLPVTTAGPAYRLLVGMASWWDVQ